MRIRSFLLAGAVLPLAAGAPAFALDAKPLAPTGWVLAQNEEECPEGAECPPTEEVPVEEAPAEDEDAPEEEAPEEEEPAPEEEEAPEEEVAPEEEAPAEVLEETLPEEDIPETLPEVEPEASAPEVDEEAETLQAVPEEIEPSLQQDETTAEEPAVPTDLLRRARRQQRELRQQETDEAEETLEEAVEGTEETVEEAPAAADAVPEDDGSETEAAQDEPAADAPVLVQPEAQPATPDDVLQRARRQQRQLRRQEREEAGEPAVEEPADTAAEPVLEEPAAATAPPPPAPSVVEQQLEATGEGEQVGRIRALREKLREESAAAAAASTPEEDAEASEDGEETDRERRRRERREGGQEAEASDDGEETDRERRRRERRESGQAEADEDDVDVDVDFRWWLRDDRDRDDRPRRDRGRGRGEVVEDRGDRIIVDLGGGNIYVEPVVPDEGERLLYGARDVEVEELPNGRTRTIVYRENGSQIVTIRDRRGNIIRRVRITPNGREVVLIDNRYEDDYVELPPVVIYEQADLPPLVIGIPEERYIVDLGAASEVEIEAALLAPPVQEIERQFTLQEVTRNERVRAYVPRIDLDTITFEFGSATIGESQLPALAELGEAMEDVLAENPDEVYLVEGHTDAVGSDYDNLILSDRRAEAVAVALSQNFDVPPENLVTEGYGEQYLKVQTPAPERENRRVTVRRITPLLQAEAEQQQ